MTPEISIIQLMLTPGIGERTLGRLLDDMSVKGVSPEEFVNLSETDLIGRFEFDTQTVAFMREFRGEATKLAEQLEERRVKTLIRGRSAQYPKQLLERLGQGAPPVLWALGNLDILAMRSIGFCGARKCSEKGMMLAASYAGYLARREINVISGYAPGIDTAAHTGAVTDGGVTTLVVAHGILNFSVRAGMDGMIDETNTLVLSQFLPDQPWRAHSAMARNRTICGMVEAMILVESGSGGGTFATGSEALLLGVPLHVVKYPEPPDAAEGNAYFLTRTEHHLDPGAPVAEALGGLVG